MNNKHVKFTNALLVTHNLEYLNVLNKWACVICIYSCMYEHK